jgi:hypothetical protein
MMYAAKALTGFLVTFILGVLTTYGIDGGTSIQEALEILISAMLTGIFVYLVPNIPNRQ